MKEDQKIVIYQTEDGKTQIDVRLENETVMHIRRVNLKGSQHVRNTYKFNKKVKEKFLVE